jgi:hypothetical protein
MNVWEVKGMFAGTSNPNFVFRLRLPFDKMCTQYVKFEKSVYNISSTEHAGYYIGVKFNAASVP